MIRRATLKLLDNIMGKNDLLPLLIQVKCIFEVKKKNITRIIKLTFEVKTNFIIAAHEFGHKLNH